MTTKASIASGDRASTASPAQVPLVLGCSVGGVVGGVGGHSYAFDPGDDVAGVLKGGPGADAVLYELATTGGRVLYQEAAPTWSPAPSVTKSGTGPTITAALASGASGCFDDHTLLLTVKVTGVNGAAQMGVCYDGSTEVETITVPLEPSPHLIGTVDLTALTLSTLNAQTLIFSAPGALTVTFTTPVSIADIANQINVAAIAGSSVIRAQVSQTSAGQFLDLYTTTGGSGVTLTLGAGTGNTTLGFTNAQTTTGAAATLTLPFTGIKLTFPSGTYNKTDTYQLNCTGPRASLSALVAAATAGYNDRQINPFGFVVVAQAADTQSNCAGLMSSLETLRASWLADTVSPFATQFVVGSAYHTASAVVATNDANIATNDAALLAAFAGQAASLNSVAVDDCYLPGATTLRLGTFRRSAALAWASKRASAVKLAADVGDGLVQSCSILAPDGKTRARDEARATTKLGAGNGPGFSVLHATSGGLGSVKFSPGATRAGSTSRLRYAGVVAVANEIARITVGVVEPWEAQTIPTNPLTKQIEEGEKKARETSVLSQLSSTLRPPSGTQNCSAFNVAIDNSGPFLDTGKVPLKVPFVPLGEIEEVSVAITAQGTLVISG